MHSAGRTQVQEISLRPSIGAAVRFVSMLVLVSTPLAAGVLMHVSF